MGFWDRGWCWCSEDAARAWKHRFEEIEFVALRASAEVRLDIICME
jgi:hypothetical protein